MGRPRKPAATLKLHGGYRKDRHGDGEPASVGQLHCPTGFDKHAQWFWDQHIEQFKENGSGGGDLGTIVECCLAYSRLKKIEAAWEKNPADYRAFCMVGMAAKLWISLASKLGLSPTERAKLRIPPKPEKTKFQVFLERKKG